MRIINVDTSTCFDDFFSKYQAILEQNNNCLCKLEIKVFERSSVEFAKYKNNPLIDQSYFDSPFMCDTSQIANNLAEIYLVTDYCDKIILPESRYALILHEFGHIIFKRLQYNKPQFEEEAFSDCIASQIIGPQIMKNALNDMIKDNRFIRWKEEMEKRVALL